MVIIIMFNNTAEPKSIKPILVLLTGARRNYIKLFCRRQLIHDRIWRFIGFHRFTSERAHNI